MKLLGPLVALLCFAFSGFMAVVLAFKGENFGAAVLMGAAVCWLLVLIGEV